MKQTIYLLLSGVMLFLLGSCKPAAGDNSANDKASDMKARFRQINEAFNTGKTEAVDTLLDANSVDHSADTAMHLPNGPAGLKQMIGLLRAGSPDMHADIKYMAVDGNVLLAYGNMKGTNSGPFMGMAATNKKWSSDYCDVIKFDDNMKMKEHWGVYDNLKMMKDLGMMPSPPPMATVKVAQAH